MADPTTDAAGSTISVDWGAGGPSAIRITLGNSALGVTNQALPLNPDSNDLRQVTLSDGRVLQVYINTQYDNSSDFFWTAYGSWLILSPTSQPQHASSIVGGFETPLSGKPTSGGATFNGFLLGAVSIPNGTNLQTAQLKGSAQMQVNWVSGAITGSATSITATPFGSGALPLAWNSLSFSGSILSGSTSFSGATTVGAATSAPFVLTAGATGSFYGQLYGPLAQELGALWNVHDATGGAAGLIVAKQ